MDVFWEGRKGSRGRSKDREYRLAAGSPRMDSFETVANNVPCATVDCVATRGSQGEARDRRAVIRGRVPAVKAVEPPASERKYATAQELNRHGRSKIRVHTWYITALRFQISSVPNEKDRHSPLATRLHKPRERARCWRGRVRQQGKNGPLRPSARLRMGNARPSVGQTRVRSRERTVRT